MTITENILTEADGFLASLVANPALTDADLVSVLTDLSGRVSEAAREIHAPLTNDQRGALFASFAAVFGSTPKPARAVFTRLALGLPADARVSWADDSPGRITARQAAKVLDALGRLEAVL